MPTITSYSSLQKRTAERIIDIPVPQSRGGGGGLLGLRPNPNSAASSSRSYAVDEAFTGFFRTFPQIKKMRGWVRTRGRNWVRTLLLGLQRLVATAWRSRRTSRRLGWSRWWRKVQRLALQLAFGQCGSARGSSSTTWDSQCGGVPVAIGAPSHTRGLSFTRKPQSMNNSSLRTFLTEAVVAGSGPGREVAGAAGRGEKRGGAVQLCRRPCRWSWTSLCSSTTSSRSPESLLWTRLSFSSSSEGGTFQLRRRDRCPQCLLTPRSGGALGAVAMPVLVWLWNGGTGEAAGGFVCLLAGSRGSSYR